MSSWRRRGTDRDISRELCVYLNQKTIRKEDTPPDITHIGLGLGFRSGLGGGGPPNIYVLGGPEHHYVC